MRYASHELNLPISALIASEPVVFNFSLWQNTSEWTLDYPPLFAWFEYLLSQVAVIIDPQMVVIQKQGYDSLSTVSFQRGSVVITDLLLAYAVKE